VTIQIFGLKTLKSQIQRVGRKQGNHPPSLAITPQKQNVPRETSTQTFTLDPELFHRNSHIYNQASKS